MLWFPTHGTTLTVARPVQMSVQLRCNHNARSPHKQRAARNVDVRECLCHCDTNFKLQIMEM